MVFRILELIKLGMKYQIEMKNMIELQFYYKGACNL